MARHLGYKVRDVKKLEARRVKAVARLRRGESTSAVARSLGVGIASVQRWARCYRLHGMEGLRRLPKSGPHPKLAREPTPHLHHFYAFVFNRLAARISSRGFCVPSELRAWIADSGRVTSPDRTSDKPTGM